MSCISEKYKKVQYLYNINSIKNLKSIFRLGLLSKNEVKKLDLRYVIDLSNIEVQSRRDNKKVPNYSFLHDYANLYFDARNPMMYVQVKNENINHLCVICISKKVLDLEGTVVTDKNAASALSMFLTPKEALNELNFNEIFAQFWIDDNPRIMQERKSKKCAEVLVFNRIPVEYLIKIKVATNKAKILVEQLNLGVPVEIDKKMFFL